MARKTLTYKVIDENRDKNKVFVLTEMAPRDGHKWATRALFAVMNGGVDIDDDVLNGGFAGLAQVGIKALGNVRPEVGGPLLDELLTCVQVMPDPSKPGLLRADWESDVEEAATIFKLQFEVLRLHTGFSIPVAQSISE